MRALVRGSAQRLSGVAVRLNQPDSLPGWQLRIVDGNHLPGSQKRLKVLRSYRGAALPGHSLVVYDPDQGIVCDLIACEDAYESERTGMLCLTGSATAGQLWIADRHFCTRTITQELDQTGAHFLIRQHTHHLRLLKQGEWSEYQSGDTGLVREQTICVRAVHEPDSPDQVWRRIGIKLNAPTESGETTLMLRTNLPATSDALTVAALYRKRWRIESMFGRLESVMHSEISSLGHPGAALLAFTVAVLGYNIISLLQRVVQQAHPLEPPHREVSGYHLAWHIKCGYEGMLIALPAELWPGMASDSDQEFVQRLLSLARRISPEQVATSKRGPKTNCQKGYIEGSLARAHISTARALRQDRATTP